MNCPEHERTLRWVYGDPETTGGEPASADDDHARHVASCPTCAAALEEAEAVLAGLAPVAAALRSPAAHAADPVVALPLRAVGTPRPARRWAAPTLATAALLAAAAVFALRGLPSAPSASPDPGVTAAISAIPADPLEDALDELDRAVARLGDDLAGERGDGTLALRPIQRDADPRPGRRRALPDL